jgi:hypothetical protein
MPLIFLRVRLDHIRMKRPIAVKLPYFSSDVIK